MLHALWLPEIIIRQGQPNSIAFMSRLRRSTTTTRQYLYLNQSNRDRKNQRPAELLFIMVALPLMESYRCLVAILGGRVRIRGSYVTSPLSTDHPGPEPKRFALWVSFVNGDTTRPYAHRNRGCAKNSEIRTVQNLSDDRIRGITYSRTSRRK
jgi:hypothetical protein